MSPSSRDWVNYAEFLRSCGMLYVEATPEQEACLAHEFTRPAASAPPARTPAAPPTRPPAERAAPPAPSPMVARKPIPAKAPAPPPDLVQSALGQAVIEGPPLSREEREARMAEARKIVEACRKCPRLSRRTQSVYGVGDPMAKIVFVGEAPGADEDACGEPFVGRAGQLLTKMIEAIGFAREEVYICNTLKCRPPSNDPPLPEEKAACAPFLDQQIEWVRPQIIVAAGSHAANRMTGQEISVGRLRGKWHSWRGIPLLVTYHPSFLLRSPGQKVHAWDDLRMLHARYNELNPDDQRKIWQK